METIYVLMPIDVARKLESGKAVSATDIPDQWETESDPSQVPDNMIACYKDDLAAKSDQQLTQAMLDGLKLAIATVNVPPERLSDDWPKLSPDPSARLLSGGINPWEFISAYYP